MTVKLSKILASTFLCVSTFSVCTTESSFAIQETISANSTLDSLLAPTQKPAALLPTKPIQQVGYTGDNGTTFRETSSLKPLVPQIPTPPRFRPQPLLPSLSSSGNGVPVTSGSSAIVQPVPISNHAPVSGVPIIAAAPLPQTTGSFQTPAPQPVAPVPVANQTTVDRPIIGAPLRQAPQPGDTFTYPSLPTRKVPVVPVVNGKAVEKPTIQPSTLSTTPASAPAPAFAATPVEPIIEKANETIAVAASKIQETQQEVEQNAIAAAQSIQSAAAKQQQSLIQAVTPPPVPMKTAPIGEVRPSLEQEILAAQSEITGDEIQVEEVSTEQLMDMIMGPSRISAQPVSATKPQTTEERMATIGSGTVDTEASTMVMANPEEVFAGTQTSPYMNAPCDTGYGCDAVRPGMPSCLPYDGCGCVSGATGYIFADYLYMDRDGGDFSASFLPANDSYDYRPGGRIRFGHKYDSIEGWEVGFTMLDAHTSNTQIISPTNSLSPLLIPANGFTLASLSSFYGASFHESFQKSHYYSAEFNRMSYNWDVMSSFIGFRFTNIDDLYGLNTVGGGGDFGTYRLRARNYLFGPQIGGELFYDIGRRLSFSASGKLAGYINLHQSNTEFGNANLLLLDNTADDVDFAWSTEMGVYARYMITPRAKLKIGYEFWYFDNVATAQGQYNGYITPYSGLRSSNSDSALYHGASFGLEWYR